MKKLFSIVAALVMCCVLFTMPSLAAETVDSGTCGADGSNLSWTLDENGVLTISGTGRMDKYCEIFTYDDRIRSVVVEEGVTSIGNHAFNECRNLTKVTLPSTLTEIGYGAFSWCESLNSIVLPEGIETIEDDTFSYCTQLNSITLPSTLTSIGDYAFEDCYALTSIELPKGLTSLGRYAFGRCEGLRQITIPASVTSIGDGCFKYCKSLTAIDVASGNKNYASVDGVLYDKNVTVLMAYPSGSVRSAYAIPSTVIEIAREAIYNAENLVSITIPEGVKTIRSRGIAYCDRLSSIHIPASVDTIEEYGIRNSSLQSITVANGNKNYTAADGVLFTKDMSTLLQYPCQNSRTYYAIPDGVKIIGENAISDCDYLEEIYVPDSVTQMGEAPFRYNYSLTAITVDKDNKIFASVDGVLFDKDKTTLICYPIAKSESTYTVPDGVETIGSWAFCCAQNLRFVEIPEGVVTIGSYAFNECDNLSMIIFPESLKTLEHYVINYCQNVTAIYFPAGLTDLGNHDFWDCNKLTDIYFGGTEEQWMALGEYSHLELPEGAVVHFQADPPAPPVFAELKWSIDTEGVLTVSGTGEMMDFEYDQAPWFERVDEVTAIVVKKGLTSIGDNAFANCYNAVSITIPEGVTSIGEYAMSWCEGLTSITLPKSLKTIGDGAFEGCYQLSSLNIPANVTSVGYDMFMNCSNLAEITVDAANKCFVGVGGVLFDKDMTTLIAYPGNHSRTSYTIPASVTMVNEGAFDFVTGLQTLTIHADVEDLGFRPFYWEEDMTNINVSADNKYYTSVDGILYDKNMTSLIHYPSNSAKTVYTMPSTVDTIEYAAICGNQTLTSLTLSKNLSRIENQGIDSCVALTQIKVNVNNNVYAGNGGVLFNKDMTTLIRYPMAKPDVSYTVPSSVVSIGEEAFVEAFYLQNVILPKGLQIIGERAFQYCNDLTSVTFPSTLKLIDEYAFSNCYSLEEVSIPEGVTGIERRAFYRCRNMTSLTLPKSLVSIGDGAFFRCDNLENVYYAGSELDWVDMVGSTDNVLTSSNVDTVIHYGSKVKLAAPTITAATSASSGKPYITWTAVDGAANYEVWRSGTKNGTYTKLITTDKLSVTHTGAVVGNDYFYKVRAVNGSVVGDFSEIKGVWCDLARPTVTVKNRASDGKPTISWTAVEGATGYEVYRCGTSTGTYTKLITTAATKLSVTHTGAAVGNDYFYKVKAIYGSNTSCNSALTAAKGVWVDLKQPTVKVLNSVSTGKPVIQWEKVDYAVGYKVYMSETSGGTYKLLYSTTNPDKLSVTHTGAKAENDYFYKVVAVHKNSKCDSAMSAAKGVWCDLARTTAKVSLNAKNKPYISWSQISGADNYEVYVSINGGTYTKLITTASTKQSVTHTGAKAGNTYTYKVRAVSAVNSKANGSYSVAQSITIK